MGEGGFPFSGPIPMQPGVGAQGGALHLRGLPLAQDPSAWGQSLATESQRESPSPSLMWLVGLAPEPPEVWGEEEYSPQLPVAGQPQAEGP